MFGSRARRLRLGSTAVALALAAGFITATSTASAANANAAFGAAPTTSAAGYPITTPPPSSKLIHDDHVTEHITSTNPRIHTRAGVRTGAVKLTRSRAKTVPRIAISKVSARVTVINWYKVKKKTRKVTKSKTLKATSKWIVKLRKTSTKVRVSAPKFKTVAFKVKAKKLIKTYPLKLNLAKDYSRIKGTRGLPVWDTCKYTLNGAEKVTKVTASRQLTFSGLSGVRSSYRADIIAALAKITATTGYTFTEVNISYDLSAHPYNHIRFTIVDNPKTSGGWSVSGYGGPTWADAGLAASQRWQLYLGGQVYMDMQTSAPSYARKLLAMHEVGHVMGLGHALSSTQVMYPTILKSAVAWGAGDKSGLNEVGYKGCRFKVGQAHIWYGQLIDFGPDS